MLIDFHSHILPAADHGSDDLETSLKQVELAGKAGMKAVVATPHFYPRYEDVGSFLRRREETAKRLREALPQNAPRILIGGEIQLCQNLERMPELDLLCIEGTNVLLLELPRSFSIRHYEQTLEPLLYERKLKVVLAHIDRYRASAIDLLLDMGFYGQLNVSSFRRLRTRRLATDWGRSGSVVALGSDMHGAEIGYKDFPRAEKCLKGDYVRIMNRAAALLGLEKT